jgi:hypothetical protein
MQEVDQIEDRVEPAIGVQTALMIDAEFALEQAAIRVGCISRSSF